MQLETNIMRKDLLFTIVIYNCYISRFCPSVFLYLSSVVPAIWLLELDKVDRRLKSRGSNINISENFDLSNLAAGDLKHLEEALGVRVIFNVIFIKLGKN